jgi:hypothetical protein
MDMHTSIMAILPGLGCGGNLIVGAVAVYVGVKTVKDTVKKINDSPQSLSKSDNKAIPKNKPTA